MSETRHMSDTAARKSRRFFLSPDLILPAFLLAVSLIIFRTSDLDLAVQKLFYKAGEGWFLKDSPVFSFIYHYGNLPALLLAIYGLILFGLSFQAYKWTQWRKIGAFLALTMLIGPGLLINTVLKDNWGRPRPRNVIEFQGKFAFEKVLSIDTSSPGKSFPCGHASMGFYLFIPWFILRKKHKLWASTSLLLGILYGLLIGLARMAQGGHWLSDVIVAGFVVYLTGTVFFRVLRLDRSIWYYHARMEIDRRQQVIVGFIVLILLVFLILGVGLATPYSAKNSYTLKDSLKADPNTTVLSLTMQEGSLFLDRGSRFKLSTQVQGFGFPRSRLKNSFTEELSGDTLKLRFDQKRKGFFTELDNEVKVLYPYRNTNTVNLTLGKGSAVVLVPDDITRLDLHITLGKGKLTLLLPKAFKPRITTRGEFKLSDRTGFTSADSVFVNEDFKVDVVVREGELVLF